MYRERTIVDQKLDDFGEKWIDTVNQKERRLIIVRAKDDDELEFVDTFFDYLLSPDALPDDIAFHFETEFKNEKQYGKALLQELETMLFEWNSAEKSSDINFETIDWTPNYELKTKNSAELFIKNINEFTQSLLLDKSVVVTIILRFYSNKTSAIISWLNNLLKNEVSPQVRIAVCDKKNDSIFDKISFEHNRQVIVVKPEVDMDNIMTQLATSGDPNDPATPYRFAFVNLMQAIGKQDKKNIEKHGKICVNIATENINKNPYWISQLIGVYMMLSNAYIALNNTKKTFRYADKAVAMSLIGEDVLDGEIYYRQQGQAFLFRGGLFCSKKKWTDAISDFKVSAKAYGSCEDYILEVEALRMQGYAAKKTWTEDPAIPLAQGARLGTFFSSETVEASSYTLLIQQLLKTSYSSQISDEELDEILIPLWGKNWRSNLKEIAKKHLEEVGYEIE